MQAFHWRIIIVCRFRNGLITNLIKDTRTVFQRRQNTSYTNKFVVCNKKQRCFIRFDFVLIKYKYIYIGVLYSTLIISAVWCTYILFRVYFKFIFPVWNIYIQSKIVNYVCSFYFVVSVEGNIIASQNMDLLSLSTYITALTLTIWT